MKTHKISINSKDITENRIKELASAPFVKKRPSKEEKKIYLKNFLYFFIAALCGIVITIILFALRRRIIALFIFLLSLIAVFVSLSELIKAFKDIRQKDAKATIKDFISIVIMGNDSSTFEKKSTKYAFDSMIRMVPDIISPDEAAFISYIEPIREYIKSNVINDYVEFVRKDRDIAIHEFNKKETAYGTTKCIKFDETTIIPDTASKISAVYVIEFSSFADPDQKNKNDFKMEPYTSFLFELDIIMIKTKGFWFLADPIPAFTALSD
jgi:hypothetical protein